MQISEKSAKEVENFLEINIVYLYVRGEGVINFNLNGIYIRAYFSEIGTILSEFEFIKWPTLC